MLRRISTVLCIAMTSAARYGSYVDAECKNPIVPALVFSDVCTWSSNQYSGSFSMYLTSCSESEMVVTVFNLTDSSSALCLGFPLTKIPVTGSCTPFDNFYVKGLDFTCESQNTTYNVLAHFTPGCQDGGYAFSMDLGEPECLEGSFGPGLFSWNARGNYSEPFYTMDLYNTTDGTCKDPLARFETKQFPATCLPTVKPFHNISIDIYPAFSIA